MDNKTIEKCLKVIDELGGSDGDCDWARGYDEAIDLAYQEIAELLHQPKKVKKIRKIANHYGYENQKLKAIEEMAELTKELIKNKECNHEIIEEIADVSIMIKQLIYLLNIEEEVEKAKKFKIKRTIKRLQGGNND